MAAKDFRSVFVTWGMPLREAIRTMNTGAVGIVLVVDGEQRLLGTVTDGDIRRGMLRGIRLEEPVEQVMHRQPVTAPTGWDRSQLLRIMHKRQVQQIPLVDDTGRVVGLGLWNELMGRPREKENLVFIPAGGMGTRLRPLTDSTPKSLLPIGDRPVLLHLIDQIAGYGFRNFLVAVHHQAQMLEEELGNVQDSGLRIRTLRESTPLGTVGALRLARAELTAPVLVVNGDLLTQVNFEHLLEFHQLQRFDLTVTVREYEVRIPYGVVRLTDGEVVELQEKPTSGYLVNAGIYILNPSVVDLIPHAARFDMTDLIQKGLVEGKRVGGFPIHEYWLDIGNHGDYEQAAQDLRAGRMGR